MTIKIEKNIEIPKRTGWKPTEFTVAISELNVGESFFIAKNIQNVTSSTNQWKHRSASDRKFTLRTVDGGTRIWRIK